MFDCNCAYLVKGETTQLTVVLGKSDDFFLIFPFSRVLKKAVPALEATFCTILKWKQKTSDEVTKHWSRHWIKCFLEYTEFLQVEFLTIPLHCLRAVLIEIIYFLKYPVNNV